MIFWFLPFVMSGDRPDYELDIFSLLVDLVERPAGPACNICYLTYISLAINCMSFVFLLLNLFFVRRVRIQYTAGVYKQ